MKIKGGKKKRRKDKSFSQPETALLHYIKAHDTVSETLK